MYQLGDSEYLKRVKPQGLGGNTNMAQGMDLSAEQDKSVSEWKPSEQVGKSWSDRDYSQVGGDTMTDIGASALMASKHPYAIGAGVGLKVLSAANRRKETQENAMRKAKSDRYNAYKEMLLNQARIMEGMS